MKREIPGKIISYKVYTKRGPVELTEVAKRVKGREKGRWKVIAVKILLILATVALAAYFYLALNTYLDRFKRKFFLSGNLLDYIVLIIFGFVFGRIINWILKWEARAVARL